MQGWREGKLLFTSEYPTGGLVYDTREKSYLLSRQWVVSGEIRVYDAPTSQKTLKKRQIDYGLGRIFYDVYRDDNVGHIKDIVLLDEARKLGIGKELVQLAERRMKHWGAKKSTGSSQPNALQFWQKMGYTLIKGSEIQKEM